MGEFKLSKWLIGTGILVAACWSLSFSQVVCGASETNRDAPEAVFKQANTAYQKGDFQEAIQLYQQLIDAGYVGGNLFYNRGNAYYKLGMKGKAILYYERAKRLIPGDADLRANLNYALNGVQEGVSDWKHDLLKFVTEIAAVDQWAVLGSAWFFGLVFLMIIELLKPSVLRNLFDGNLRKWWLGIIICNALIFVCILSLGLLTYWDQSREYAVAVKADAVRFEPSEKATLYYQLSEGSRVQILERKGEWVMIKRIDGKRGWVVADCLEMI